MEFLGIFRRYRGLKFAGFVFLMVFLSNLVLFLGFVFPSEMKRNEVMSRWGQSRDHLNRLHLLKNAESQLNTWKGLLRSKEDFSDLISKISKQAKQNRIDIPSISYQQEELELKGLSKISFSFSIINRYDRIRKFIHDIETSEDFLVIEELVIEKLAKEEGREVEAQMKLSTYLVEGRSG